MAGEEDELEGEARPGAFAGPGRAQTMLRAAEQRAGHRGRSAGHLLWDWGEEKKLCQFVL